MSGALGEANDSKLVLEKVVAASNGALACHTRFGGGAPPTRCSPAHNRLRSRRSCSDPRFQLSGTPTIKASGSTIEKEGSNHDEVLAHLNGMSLLRWPCQGKQFSVQNQ